MLTLDCLLTDSRLPFILSFHYRKQGTSMKMHVGLCVVRKWPSILSVSPLQKTERKLVKMLGLCVVRQQASLHFVLPLQKTRNIVENVCWILCGNIVENVCWNLCGQKTGFTPLYLAAQENGADIVDMLLQAGADQRIHTVSWLLSTSWLHHTAKVSMKALTWCGNYFILSY